MADYKILKTLYCIIQIVNREPGISKEKLTDKLLNFYDLDVPSRTLDRYFSNLRNDYGLKLDYNSTHRGYFIESEKEVLTNFFKFAELSAMAEIFEKGTKDYHSFQKWVMPEDSSNFKGVDNIQLVVKALSLKHQLSFKKENYNSDNIKEYVVSPLFIKEYLNRWYLVAVPKGIAEIRNFGMDRISNLKIVNTKAESRDKYESQIDNYKDIVGLNYNEKGKNSPETIKIAVTNFQIKYLRSLPLHHSQVLIENENSNWGTAIYKLKPNYEFKTQLLRMNSEVKVIEPEWFKEEIKKDISNMMNLYN